MYEFGIPGYLVPVLRDVLQAKPDPAPGVEKQLITRFKNKTTIEYETEGKLLPHVVTLPEFDYKDATNFLFYCHSPDVANEVAKENYEVFLKHAWPEARDDPSFFVCIMHNVETDFQCGWLSKNTIIIRRPNLGLDFGAFADALHFTSLDKCLDEKQFYVFFMNDTVCGPTFPWWIKPKPKWTDVFRSMLNTDVKLAGMTINPWFGTPHVQSMMMVTDNVGLKIGLEAKVFARRSNKDLIINISEAGFSTAILKHGFNIDCAAQLLHGHDYRLKQQIPSQVDDVTYDNRYFGGFSIHPLETVFSKTNRMHRKLANKLL